MDNVILATCDVAYDATATTASDTNTYIEIKRLTEVGDIGLLAERKEKTSLEDEQMTYGRGIQDMPERQFSGQIVPPQAAGDTYFAEYEAQQAFFTLCEDGQPMMIRVSFKSGMACEFFATPLGFSISSPDPKEWMMFSIPMVQNSKVTRTEPTLPPLTPFKDGVKS